MIPTGGVISNGNTVAARQPSRTWKLDLERGRISGMTDGLEAVKQSVFKILQTERFVYLIYSANYGTETRRFLGSAQGYLESEIKRRIREALLQDDRISDVRDFAFAFDGDSVLVEFTVVSIFGSFQIGQEVSGVV